MIRVFPRKTKWSPTDDLAFFDEPPLFDLPDLPVYISVTFTEDKLRAERLYKSWKNRCSDVQVGGPAYDDPGDEFEPGRFLRPGVTITSRGCKKNCPFCYVPKREGKIRELKIKDGWIVQDNNLLACKMDHIIKVFKMLQRQPMPASFPGGLDVDYLKPWHIEALEELRNHSKLDIIWVAFDGDQGMKRLSKAKDMLADFHTNKKFAYVLIGYEGDTLKEAEKRCETVYKAGFLPFAMLFDSNSEPNWKQLQRRWARPAIYRSKRKIVIAKESLDGKEVNTTDS